jgi:RNA polymerase sigma-70 factor (ECF subfamily)
LDNLVNIIKGCILKEPKFQRQLYDRYRGFATKIVFRYIYRFEKANDIVTDGFVKAFKHFDNFDLKDEEDAEKLLMGWLKKIMIHTAIDELRKTDLIPEIGGIPEEVWEISEHSDNADQLLLYKELVSLVKQLPPALRVVFNLYVIDGYSHSQVAKMVRIPVGTSRSNLARAKSFLQTAIKKMEEDKLCRI